MVARKGYDRSPCTRRMQRGPSKASALQSFLVLLEGEPFQEIPTQPRLGAGQPAEVSQVVAHLPDELHFLIKKWLSRKSQRWGSVWTGPRARRSKRAWFRFFSITMAGFMPSEVLPHSSWEGFCRFQKRVRPPC